MRHEPQSLKRFLKCFELLTYRSSRVTRSSGDLLLREAIEMVQDPDFACFGVDPAQNDAQEGAAIWITLRSIDGRLKDVSVPFLAMVVPEAVEAGVCGDGVQPLKGGLPRITETLHAKKHLLKHVVRIAPVLENGQAAAMHEIAVLLVKAAQVRCL